jgi:hypothetical protein
VRRRGSAISMLCGAAIGAGFFLWIAGVRLIDPREIGWLMRLDWQIHFLAWHIFRHEPWQWPPGRIAGEFYPVGTSIAYTDSVPLAALLLKPFARVLPDPFQYLGGWLLICFALQGAAGAALIGCWTQRTALRVAGALLFVLSPVLLDRVGHVALASHWLLLSALWLYFRRWSGGAAARIGGWALLVFLTACVQPYLWAMVVALSAAAAIRYATADRAYRARDVVAHLAAMAVASAVAAWAVGWFVISSPEELSVGGLGYYSMNLLGLFASNGWAALGPAIPVFEGQTYEGFNYPGAGVLALAAIATMALLMRRPARRTVIAALPLLAACGLMALASLSPKITFGQHVVTEIALPARVAVLYSAFRSTGRFFWPAGYLLTAGAIAAVAARFQLRTALLILIAAAAVQGYDLRSRYVADRALRSDASWFEWNDPTRDRVWPAIAATHRHLVLVPPEACGPEPAPYEPLMYLAGRYGLTLNSGRAGRMSVKALAAACGQMMSDVHDGRFSADTIYVTADAAWLRAKADPIPLTCHPLAGAAGCVIENGSGGLAR